MGFPSLLLKDRSSPALDPDTPYLGIHAVEVFVRDQDRSLQFYLNQLGFDLVLDSGFNPESAWSLFPLTTELRC